MHELVERLVSEIPLLEADSTKVGFQPEALEELGGSLYFGTGLTTPKAISAAVPFDFLGMVMVAEKTRQILKLDRIVHLIADTHAKSNEFVTDQMAEDASQRMLTACDAIRRLDILQGAYFPVRSSVIDQTPDYLEVFNGIKTEDHEYVRREWADIAYMHKHRAAQVKLSWTIGPKANKVGFDERLYDLRFREVMGLPMSFVYMSAGRTLDKERAKASPYISIPTENRILFHPNERVEDKLEQAANVGGAKFVSGVTDHLALIVRMFEDLRGPVDWKNADTVGAKVQTIINRAFA